MWSITGFVCTKSYEVRFTRGASTNLPLDISSIENERSSERKTGRGKTGRRNNETTEDKCNSRTRRVLWHRNSRRVSLVGQKNRERRARLSLKRARRELITAALLTTDKNCFRFGDYTVKIRDSRPPRYDLYPWNPFPDKAAAQKLLVLLSSCRGHLYRWEKQGDPKISSPLEMNRVLQRYINGYTLRREINGIETEDGEKEHAR